MPIIVKKTKDNSKTMASAAAVEPASPVNGELLGKKNERSRPPVNRRIPPSRPSGDNRRRVALKDKRQNKSSSSSSSSSTSSSSGSSSSSSSDDTDSDGDEKPEGEVKSPPPPGGARTKDLAGFFARQTDDSKVVRRKRFEVDEAPGTLVLENEPQRLEGVVRADDPGEWDKPIEIEKGRAKLIASMLQAKKDDNETTVPRRRFRLEGVERGDSVVLENEPVVLEGVARSGEPQQADDEIFQERGRIKNMAERWKRQQQEHDDSDEDVPEKPKKPAWLLELESAKESGVYETESTPVVRDDVVRADDDEPDVISVQRTRNLRKMWTQIEQDKLQQDKETDDRTKKVTQTNRRSTETDSDEESDEETSSEEEKQKKQEAQRRRFPVRPGGGGGRTKEDLADRGRVPNKKESRTRRAPSSSSSSSSDDTRSSSSEESTSKTKLRPTFYVNEASLKYVLKKE